MIYRVIQVNLIRIRRVINEAHAAFDTARENLELARAREVAAWDTDVMIAQRRLKTATDFAAFTTAEMDVSPSPAGAEALTTAQGRLEPAQTTYHNTVESVINHRRNEMERLLTARVQLEDAYLNCVNGTYRTIQGAYDRTTYAIDRDFEAPEELAIMTSTHELVGLAEIINTHTRQFRDMVENLCAQSLRSERTSSEARQSIIQKEAFTTRLPTISAGKLVVEGNFGLALTLRNLAARNFRVSYKLMPREHSAPLMQDSNLSNVTWFETFRDLFEWHCGLGTLETPRITENHPAISSKESEAGIRQDLLAIVQAEVPDPELPAGLDRIGAASHLSASRRARERLARLHNYVDLVSAEILIFMLVREISKFEELDAARRLVLGIDSAVYDYYTVVGHSLWESVTIERAKREFQLDNFVYQDAYWFKRLQVLLGHEFAQNISTQSPSSRLVQECGAKDIADLVEMLILEIERFLKIYIYQEELADYLKRTIMNSSRFGRRRLVANARAHASKRPKGPIGPRDRRSPMQRFERDTAFRSGHSSDMNILEDARAKLADWRLPEWLSYLILTGQKIDYTGTTIGRLLTPPPVFLLPDMTMPHAPWMRAIVSLLNSDPDIELDSWDGLRKWWRNGIYIQGIGLADEHVEQAVLPDLANIMQDGRAPNPVPQRVIQNRRIHNATHRAFVNTSHLADRGFNMPDVVPPTVPADVPAEVPAEVPADVPADAAPVGG
ncbi:hypothetical protein P167DRAFT_232247 [Morchella conica CCBAS932]|uniref:Uncharacterized protein n=1 Tax=Morchella conica CCBAS932 TaxID=1392247 RepID=A0A3N4KKC3_9PEZI|nr:hypothetical protein P167DRAFT_232247 [Morchella conica CCBAS932]